MTMAQSHVRIRPAAVLPADIAIDKRADGTMIVRHKAALKPYPAALHEPLEHWAKVAPDRIFLAQRDGSGPWQTITYAGARAAARNIASALLDRHLSPDRPIVFLTGNDLGQALLGLGAMYAGVPFAPVSPAYATLSQDFGKLKFIMDLLKPGLVYASTGAPLAKAIAAAVPSTTELVVTLDPPPGRNVTRLADLAAKPAGAEVDAARARITPDTIVKFLFTSGSTGMPKAVINTQRMMMANIQMVGQSLPFSSQEPPVLVDWLPWSHTFGGNHNFNYTLMFGGSLYIDDGRPLPGLIETSARNLREIAPTIYFNVPKGYEALLPILRSDPALAQKFFSRLKMMFYAGASLPQHIWEAVTELAIATTGERIQMFTGLGSTETAPATFMPTGGAERSGVVGVPMPGIDVTLVPVDGKLECRLKGPHITPGYWKSAELTKAAFDEEGFYRLGDALKFADPNNINLGFVFDGRVAEDFKLGTGTWVSVGPLRARVVAACAPMIRDAVIAGQDRSFIAAMLVPDLEPCRAFTGLPATATPSEICAHPKLRDELTKRLANLASQSKGSSTRVNRALILDAMLSIDSGEVTDKGSINQRAVLKAREGLVGELYAAKVGPRVIEV
jgi:feruloyl-CoA synthase